MSEGDRRPLRAGIIGTARVGSWYDDLQAGTPELIPSSHAGCYAACPRTELVAGSDLDPERLERFGKKWGIRALYADYREMLANEALDVVSITTSWGHDHAAIAPVVAESGVRGIFCEKPIATSMAEADRIVRLVEQNGVKFACAYLRRWNPRYHALRAAIDSGAVGRLVSITAIGAGNLMHAGTHYADIMAYLAGDPEPAWAWGRIEPVPPDAKSPTARVDPVGSGYVEMQSGVRFFLEGVSPGAITFVVSGTEGKLMVFNDARRADLWRRPQGSSDRWLEPESLPVPPQTRSPVLPALEDLVASIDAAVDGSDPSRQPANDVRRAARAMELCLALHASHRRGGCRVELPLEDRELSVDTW
ncbi:MAG: Gfo/Idh/MocA family oxidoreductase [Chloroflexi bacterium]|nr:Gfo/Idh/MocA family oxidoreductase [Chloroflexota bacterium]